MSTLTSEPSTAPRTGVALDQQTNPLGPALPDLSPKAELALLARLLFHEGYDDHLAGHITIKQPDGTLLTNPFGLTWDEIRAGDVMTMDVEGNVLDGPWTVSPAIVLHLAMHAVREDIGVLVHNHPVYGTLWADAHRVPPIYDQTGAMVVDDIAIYPEYDGTVNEWENSRKIADAVGHARMALLANHGVMVTAPDVPRAHHRAVVLEWRCRNAWRLEAFGRSGSDSGSGPGSGGGVPLKPDQVDEFGRIFDYVPFPHLWEAMVRRELRRDPSVLDEA